MKRPYGHRPVEAYTAGHFQVLEVLEYRGPLVRVVLRPPGSDRTETLWCSRAAVDVHLPEVTP